MKKIFCFLTLSLIFSCSYQVPEENWDEFYQTFHSDSLFQVSRLGENFVGKGFYGEKVEKITKDNWSFLRSGIYDVDSTKYKTEIIFEKNKVKTRVYVDNSGIDIQSTFKKYNGKWFLIEHSDNFN
ncbi:MAG: hypothetical protein PF445_08485 [Melioribacteraceae bacterium]|jgi:hypothetical protein|nr:hypothetical protein [Melioribacteraceae bacterium]